MTMTRNSNALEDLASPELQHEIEQFLYFEARLLDEWRWRDWFDLFSEDAKYWMPTRKNRLRVRSFEQETAPGIQMAHFDEDNKSLESRVKQMESGTHWAEDPPSRVRHLVTNVYVQTPSDDRVDEYAVRSYFLCYRNRLETEVDIWAGQRDDILRRTENSFEIAKRTILLDQNVIIAKNLSVFF